MLKIIAVVALGGAVLAGSQLVAQNAPAGQGASQGVAAQQPERRLWRNINNAGKVLKGWSFAGSWIEDSSFSKSVLMNSNFSGTLLRRVEMKASNMIGANFSGAVLEDVDFSASNLTKACFINARLIRVKFKGANIQQAAFTGAKFEGGGPEINNIAATAEYGPKTCPQ